MTSDKPIVLVTGGAGYIGGQTVLSLMTQGFDIVVLDDFSTGHMLPFLSGVKVYEGRVHDTALVTKILKVENIGAILHFAGSIRVDESIENPFKYYENNTLGSQALIKTALDNKVQYFIFSSTAAVYGLTGNKPVSEDMVPMPLNPYGWSKLMTEQMLQDACRVSEMKYGIYRYFNVAGADSALRHGQYLKKPVHLIGRAIRSLFTEDDALTIFGNDHDTPDGTGVRDYIHVEDVADAHVSLLKYFVNGGESTLMNLGYSQGSSVLEVVKAVESCSGKQVAKKIGDKRIGEASSVISNVSRLKDTLDWRPRNANILNIVQSAYDWYKYLVNK